MLACFVHHKDGSSCNYVVHEDVYQRGLEAQLAEIAQLVTHLMEHISELNKRASHRWECPEHPNAPHIIHGEYRRVTCGYEKHERGKIVEWCDKELKEILI